MGKHVHGRPGSEREFLDDLLGRGKGDWDSYGDTVMTTKQKSPGQVTHGRSKVSPIYTVWKSMRQRCYNKASRDYPRYGGRGIRVCERWQDFTNFENDMGARPSPKHSIERLDNNGNYEPNNCKWATQLEQQNNKSRNGPGKLSIPIANEIRRLHREGQTQVSLAKQYDVSKQTICDIVNNKHYRNNPDYWGNPAEKEASQPKVKKNITTPGLTNPTSITQQNKTSTGQKGKHS